MRSRVTECKGNPQKAKIHESRWLRPARAPSRCLFFFQGGDVMPAATASGRSSSASSPRSVKRRRAKSAGNRRRGRYGSGASTASSSLLRFEFDGDGFSMLPRRRRKRERSLFYYKRGGCRDARIIRMLLVFFNFTAEY